MGVPACRGGLLVSGKGPLVRAPKAHANGDVDGYSRLDKGRLGSMVPGHPLEPSHLLVKSS